AVVPTVEPPGPVVDGEDVIPTVAENVADDGIGSRGGSSSAHAWIEPGAVGERDVIAAALRVQNVREAITLEVKGSYDAARSRNGGLAAVRSPGILSPV